MANETLSVKITANAMEFNNALKEMGERFDGVKDKLSSLSNVGDGMKQVGATMTAVGAGITAGIGAIVAKGAEWSASVESTEFLYKNLDKTVQKAIANNAKEAKSIGLTTQQYKSGATEMATYFKNLGLAAKESANMSGETMNLVADLAAVADVPFDDALGDFKSALMGNYEAVDKYGVSLSAAALENSEFCKELGKSWNELSENEKMLVAYNEIMRQSGSAQGLAKQEAQSFGMQIKLLKEQLAETVGTIGAQLLPVLEPLVQKFSEAVQKVADWVTEHPKLTQAILLFVGILGGLLVVFGPILMVVGTCITMFASLAAASAALGVSMGVLCAVPLLIVAAFLALAAAGVYLYYNWEEVKAKAISIWNTIKTAILNVVTTIVSGLINDFNAAKVAVISVWNSLKSAASSVWNGIKSTISNVVNGIKSSVTNGFNAVKSVATNAWNGIKNTVTKSINAAKDAVQNAINKIKSILTGFKPSWSIPKPKLPKISISIGYKTVGSLKIPYPDFNVSWNAKGGIFNKPTIFATPNAGLQGVGERGAEAILPLKSFYTHLDEKLDNNIDYNRLGEAVAYAMKDIDLAIEMDKAKVGQVMARTNEKIQSQRLNLSRRGLIL